MHPPLTLALLTHVACAAATTTTATTDRLLPASTNVTIDVAVVAAPEESVQYVDVAALAYSTTPLRPSRKNVTAVSVVWGAGNSHGRKTLDQALALVDDAHNAWPGLDILLFPECFLYNGSNAETIEGGPIVGAMRRKAAALGIHIVVPIYELLEEGQAQDGPTFNTAVVVGRQGEVVGRYHKHFPTVTEIDANVMPGLDVPVFDLDFGRAAIAICWDFNFPELWHALAAQDVDVVFWPSAAKGAENVQGHAMLHNFFVASNGLGQFYDQIGRPVASAETRNSTCGASNHDGGPVQMTKATLDLDSGLIFYGGPSTKQDKIKKFLATNEGRIHIAWTSDVSKLHLLHASAPGVSVRRLLREAGIETRQEEETRTRLYAEKARRSRSQNSAMDE